MHYIVRVSFFNHTLLLLIIFLIIFVWDQNILEFKVGALRTWTTFSLSKSNIFDKLNEVSIGLLYAFELLILKSDCFEVFGNVFVVWVLNHIEHQFELVDTCLFFWVNCEWIHEFGYTICKELLLFFVQFIHFDFLSNLFFLFVFFISLLLDIWVYLGL